MRVEIGHILSAKHLGWVAVVFFTVLLSTLSAQGPEKEWRVGASKADITPEEPIRLSGYGSRTQPTIEIDDRLFTRAMCLQYGEQPPLILVSLDAIGLSAFLTDQIHAKLKELYSLERKQVVLCTTHSHTAPQLDDVLPNLYSTPLTEVRTDPACPTSVARQSTRLFESSENRSNA